MTILQKPPPGGDRRAGKRWYRFAHAEEAVRYTEAWEHETFAEEQARWERSDPQYARICDEVRQARQRGEAASRRADYAKAEWDARVATRRQAEDGAQKARYALKVDYTAKRQTATSRVLALRRQLDSKRRAAGRAVGDPVGGIAHRQDARQPQIPPPVTGAAPATTHTARAKPTR